MNINRKGFAMWRRIRWLLGNHQNTEDVVQNVRTDY
jgi:hypothetical protein